MSELTAGIEERTTEEERSSRAPTAISVDLAELLDAAIASNVRREAIVAVNEITSRASLARFDSRALSRGLPKIALSAGLAGAFGLAAFGSFERRALIFAMGSFTIGLLGSASARLSLSRGKKAALRQVKIAEALADQVRARWPEEEGR